MTKISCLIFDMSGVLIDDLYPVWLTLNDTLSFYGFNPAISLKKFKEKFKFPIREFYRSIRIPEEKIEEVDRKWWEFYRRYQHLVKPFPEVKEVLPQLKAKNLRLGIISSTLSNILEEFLYRFEILDYFEAIIGRDNCEEEKPSPRPILTLLSKLNTNPKNAAYVGDMEEDVIAGKKAGVYTIAIDRREAYKPIWKLKLYKPDYVITNLNDLLKIV